jgi:hypothetical protein
MCRWRNRLDSETTGKCHFCGEAFCCGIVATSDHIRTMWSRYFMGISGGEASVSWPSLRPSLISSFQGAATFFGSSDEFFGQPVDNGVDEVIALDEYLSASIETGLRIAYLPLAILIGIVFLAVIVLWFATRAVPTRPAPH